MKYLLRDFARFVLGPLCFVAALWIPFYIGGPVLPDGWTDPLGPKYWWSLPMFVSLIALFIGLAALGAYLISFFKR